MGVNKRLIGAGATDTGGGGGAITADSHFKGVTYQGTGSTRTVGGLNFQPDFVWIKNYGDGEADRDHKLFDSTRGIKEALQTNVDNGQDFSNSHLLDFLPSGFEVGNDNDINGTFLADQFVAWCWHADSGNTSSNSNGTITSTVQANDVAGFSIVKYTGNGSSGASIGHGLSVQPNMIISKNMDSSVAELANKKIASYSKYLPTNEDAFFNGYKEGDTYTVGCWINESTKVRIK